MIELKFKKDDDGSGDGTLIIYKDGFDLFFIPVTHTNQLDEIKELIGVYVKV